MLRFQKDLRPHLSLSYRFHPSTLQRRFRDRSHMVASVRHLGYSRSSGLASGHVYSPFSDRIVFSVHTNPFSNENEAVFLRIRLSFTTTPKTITENGAIRKRSPEWSDLKTILCGRRKRCYLKTVTSSTRPGARPLDREYPKWRTDTTMWILS